jgi:hypothetical protein
MKSDQAPLSQMDAASQSNLAGRRPYQTVVTQGFRVVRLVGAGRMPFLWKSMIMIAQKPEESGQ